jgi:hypothetical protein
MDLCGKRTGKLAEGVADSMNRKIITTVIIFSVTGTLIVYDVWASFVPGATISEVMLKLGHYHPIIPFGMGVLVGHFWWSQQAESTLMGNTFPDGARRASVMGVYIPPVSRFTSYIPLLLGITCIACGLILALTTR